MMVEHNPLLPPYLWRAAMSHKPDKLRPHPSSEDMVSMEGGEGFVGVSVAWLVVGLKSTLRLIVAPSLVRTSCRLMPIAQIQIIDLFMVLTTA